METSKTTSNTSNKPETPKAEEKKATRRQKPKLVKRSKDSFRPGSVANETVVKALKFIIPCGTGISNDQEMMAVRDLAVQSSQAAGVEVNAVGVRDHAWEIVLKLQPVEGEDDDKLVSDAFRKLDDTIKASVVLKDGFQPKAPPRWEFKNGDFVADQGPF